MLGTFLLDFFERIISQRCRYATQLSLDVGAYLTVSMWDRLGSEGSAVLLAQPRE
jgi:hypothetical protein